MAKTEKLASVDGKKRSKYSAKRLAGLKKGGRPKGVKNRSTLLREQALANTAAIIASTPVAPLELMLKMMNEAASEYEALRALPAPADEKTADLYRRAMGAARNRAMDAAVAAAPYCHAKLQSVDKTVSKGVVIEVKEYRFDDAGDSPSTC